jgi:hypothetical protein
MNRTVKNLFDRGTASMPVCMILIAGTLTKVGYPAWGLAWIAALCAPLILADLSHFRGQDQAPL